MDRLDPWLVTGFVEGEGSFTFSRARGGNVTPSFALRAPSEQRPLLEALQRFFGGAGRIYALAARPRREGGVTRPALYYRIARRQELGRVVEHFDAYPLQGAKAGSYRIWRRMVRRKLALFDGPSRLEMELLARKLSASKKRNR